MGRVSPWQETLFRVYRLHLVLTHLLQKWKHVSTRTMRSLSLGTRQSSELSFGLRLKNAAFQNGIISHILYAEAEQLLCGYQKLSSSTAHWALDIRTHSNGVHIQDCVSLLTSLNNIHFCSDPKAKSFYGRQHMSKKRGRGRK